MLFPIMLFLMVFTPLFIPVAVTVVHAFGEWRGERADRPVGACRRMAAPLPAAA